VVVLITYFSIVLGELVPKRIGQTNPEAVARVVARPIEPGWQSATTPFVSPAVHLDERAAARILASESTVPNVTEEEIHAMLAEGTSAGVIEIAANTTMVRNVFRLDDRQIGSLMVPRGGRRVPRSGTEPARGEPDDASSDRPFALPGGAKAGSTTSSA
jgi:putative hemolysin